jgi:DNA-binding transcriptional regulator YhcF (GntR family)
MRADHEGRAVPGAGEQLARWIRDRLREAGPGGTFPTDRALAKRFGVSDRYVRKVMNRYRDQGLVVRVRGKGTFSPGIAASTEEIEVPRKPTDRAVGDAVREMIHCGDIKRGEPLPPVKYLAVRLKVSQGSVIAAYRGLCATGLVVKIGRTFWVGDLRSVVFPRRRRDIVFFRFDTSDYEPLFTASLLSLAYRKMEKELSAYGYRLHYESTANLEQLSARWKGSGAAPHAVVLCEISNREFETVLPLLRPVFEGMRGHAPRLFIDLSPKGEEGPDTVDVLTQRWDRHLLARGHLFTSSARALAHYLVERGYRAVTVFHDEVHESRRDLWSFVAMFRIRAELKRLDRDFSFRIVIRRDRPGGVRGYFKHHSELRNAAEAEVARYGERPAAIAEEIVGYKGQKTLLADASPHRAVVLATGEEAAKVFDRGIREGLRFPRDMGIVTLQVDSRYLDRGITYCGPDWETIGYLMAHAVMGDIAVARTRKGFIRTRATVMERMTTR